MGLRKNLPAVMKWQSTLGAMKQYGTIVQRTCFCGFYGRVDLDHMIELLGGDDMTVWDCRPPCPICDRLMFHTASPGEGTPFRPLISPAPWGDLDRLPFEAWTAGWTGWNGPTR